MEVTDCKKGEWYFANCNDAQNKDNPNGIYLMKVSHLVSNTIMAKEYYVLKYKTHHNGGGFNAPIRKAKPWEICKYHKEYKIKDTTNNYPIY
jgi:hypothetical protein